MSTVTDKNKVDPNLSLKSSFIKPANLNDPRPNVPMGMMGNIIDISREKMDPHRRLSGVKIRTAKTEKPAEILIAFVDNPQVLKSEQPNTEKVAKYMPSYRQIGRTLEIIDLCEKAGVL